MRKRKKVVDCLKERLRETKTVNFLVLLYLLCLLYSYTHTQKGGGLPQRAPPRDQKTVKVLHTQYLFILLIRKKKKGGGLDYLNERPSQVLHTVSLYFTTLTLLTLLKGGGLSERTPSRDQDRQVFRQQVLSLLVLLVQKYKY